MHFEFICKVTISDLEGNFAYKLKTKWASLLEDAIFFFKLRHIYRFYRQYSKQKLKEAKKVELGTKANLKEVASALLHEDACDVEQQGEVIRLKI